VLRDDVTYSTWIYKTWFATAMGYTFAMHDGERHARERCCPALSGTARADPATCRPAAADEVVGALPDGDVDLVGRSPSGCPGLVWPRSSFDGGPRAVPAARAAISWGLLSVSPGRRGRRGPPRAEAWTAERIASAKAAPPARRPPPVAAWSGREHALDRDSSSPTSTSSRPQGSTVDYALRNVLWALLAHTEHAAAVVGGDGDAVDPVVTETFRYAPPVPHEGRIVTTDVEWYGRVVPEGSIVRVALASATNDESVFASPRRFDPGRADVWAGDSRGGVRRDGASSHLAFGLGSHFCAGYSLPARGHEGSSALPRPAPGAGRAGAAAETAPAHLTVPTPRLAHSRRSREHCPDLTYTAPSAGLPERSTVPARSRSQPC
jgi:hypothetical protein